MAIAVARRSGRTSGWPQLTPKPIAMSRHTDGDSSTAAGTSGRRIEPSSAAETTYEIASITIANGAVSAWMRSPARLGPPISATASVASIVALAATRCSLPTRVGRYALSAIWNAAVAIPTTAATR